MRSKASAQTLSDLTEEEWQARIALAAVHRLAFMQGLSEGIANHVTLLVRIAVTGTIGLRSDSIGPRSKRRPSWRSALMMRS